MENATLQTGLFLSLIKALKIFLKRDFKEYRSAGDAAVEPPECEPPSRQVAG